MANRWGYNGNSDRVSLLGSRITADGDCSHEIKRRLLLRRKAMTNLELSLGPKYVFLAGKLYQPNSQAVPSVFLLRVAAGVAMGISASAQQQVTNYAPSQGD